MLVAPNLNIGHIFAGAPTMCRLGNNSGSPLPDSSSPGSKVTVEPVVSILKNSAKAVDRIAVEVAARCFGTGLHVAGTTSLVARTR